MFNMMIRNPHTFDGCTFQEYITIQLVMMKAFLVKCALNFIHYFKIRTRKSMVPNNGNNYIKKGVI